MFQASLLYARDENIKQLLYKIVYSLVMSRWGPKVLHGLMFCCIIFIPIKYSSFVGVNFNNYSIGKPIHAYF